MDSIIRSLRWPIVSLLITGALHFSAEAIWPDLRTLFVAPSLAPLLLAYGVWTGSSTVGAGGGFTPAIVAGAILGLLPLALDVVGFGMILGHGVSIGTLAGVYGFAMVVFGSLLGAGFEMSRKSA